MRYNRTNFVTASVAVRILKAMRDALKDGFAHYVENRRGQRWLRVNVLHQDGPNSRLTYQFLADNGQDVGHLILQALFVWSDDHEREFTGLVGELYEMHTHPYSVNRQKALEEQKLQREQEHKAYLKALGITHAYRTPTGVTYLGRWERRWWGSKRFVAIADAKGHIFAKPFELDRESALYGTIQGVFA